MGRRPTLLDHRGQPVRRAEITKEQAGPTITGVRSPISGYPGDGLDPLRLASILKAADQGDPVRYLELAETIEERDLHYAGVLGTRKRSVSQIDITVEAGGDDARSAEIVERIEAWLRRDELSGEIRDILDAIGKGFSFTNIVWDVSQQQYEPAQLIRRDPRWFRFDRNDLTTPMMLDEAGQEQPLPAFSFIYANIAAKSGLPLRSGLSRIAAWAYMFKKYTERDWQIFQQTYGQPLRLGKFQSGASEEDRNTLYTAVANIAGDCAAIIPASMEIEFVEAANVGAATDLYEKKADWLDKQISKAVLGQTSTTDAEIGGLGSGKEHREVQEDIERADAKDLSAILNRDLIRPWVDLEWGPQQSYPRLVIARPEQEDLTQLADSLEKLVPLGLEVEEDEVRAKFGLSKPKPGAKLLGRAAPVDDLSGQKGGNPAQGTDADLNGDENTRQNALKHPSNGLGRKIRESVANGATPLAAAISAPPSPEAVLAETLKAAAAPAMSGIIEQIEAMMTAAGSLAELREMLLAAYTDIDGSELVDVLAQALAVAHLGGVAEVEEEDG